MICLCKQVYVILLWIYSTCHFVASFTYYFGKEMDNFASRRSEVGKIFTEVQILGKCAGAVGNYNAHKVAYPDINWPNIAAEFVNSLGIGFPYVTQACLLLLSVCSLFRTSPVHFHFSGLMEVFV